MLSPSQVREIAYFLSEAAYRAATTPGENPDKIQLIPQSDIEWLPPVPRPGKICGVALNNSASDERKISSPDLPNFALPTPEVEVHGGSDPVHASHL